MYDYDDLPPDPDMDDLPCALAEHDGLFEFSGIGRDDRRVYAGTVTREDLAWAFALARRTREDDRE